MRVALLEADVALPVVKHFIDAVRAAALGEEVVGSLTPGQALVGVVHRELSKLMGEANVGLDLATQPPAVILMAGLQGSGKTTTTGKLARILVKRQEEGRGGFRRRLSPGGDRAIEDRGRARPARRLFLLPQVRKPVDIARARSTTRARTTWTCSSSTPPAASRSTRR